MSSLLCPRLAGSLCLTFGLAVLSSCASGPVKVDPASFSPIPLDEAGYMPTPEEVTREKPRVAILPLELRRGQDAVAKREATALEPALRSELESALLRSDKVTLLDRNLAQRLQSALADYERNKGTAPAQFGQADYLVISQIDLAATDSNYRQPTTNSKGRVVPGVCINEGKVSGVLKIYDILANTTVGIKEISGNERDVNESAGCAPLTDQQTQSLYQQATGEAVGRADTFIQEFFAPQGFIAEKRSDGSSWVFKVSTAGKAMAEYKTVTIFDRRRVKNALTGVFEFETLSLGTASITDQSGENFVWVSVTDRKLANQIRLGHLVKPASSGFSASGLLNSLDLN